MSSSRCIYLTGGLVAAVVWRDAFLRVRGRPGGRPSKKAPSSGQRRLSIKLASAFFFPKVIAMTKRFSPLPPGWVQARLYHLLAPLAALVAVACFEQTWIGELLEDQTVNLRFRARAAFDPPADPRLVFVGIDQQSLDKFGRYPWPRPVMANFLTSIAKANANPHTVAFDILYTEQSSNPADDAALGDAAALLPSVITAALSVKPSGVSKKDAGVIKAAEERTKTDLKDPGPTMPFTQIHGDARKIRGSNIATLPVAPVREQSLFGFANDEPSPVDYIR